MNSCFTGHTGNYKKCRCCAKKVPVGMFPGPGRCCQMRDGLGGRIGVGMARQDQTLTIVLVSFVEGFVIDID